MYLQKTATFKADSGLAPIIQPDTLIRTLVLFIMFRDSCRDD
jgi:hypothetical protein